MALQEKQPHVSFILFFIMTLNLSIHRNVSRFRAWFTVSKCIFFPQICKILSYIKKQASGKRELGTVCAEEEEKEEA